ncbi:2-keto-4-pentenoate hydratase [Rothia uropygialis]|uniref:2-keto-4-pentenoate hydratase n=1 Tax=Kocuria sp. 36 TaxID=1415402 RepID=UPI00101BB49E|nr:fumarylacetoacetate hydrolase family protein [Kocuria sp. 36]
MSIASIEDAVKELLAAESNRQSRGRITDEWPELDIDTAYEVQDALIAQRVENGEHVVGVKLGLTSRAKQQRMGIDSPLTATLTDAYMLAADQPVPLDKLIHPRVEPEIVFVMGEDLSGPGITSATALNAVESVYAGFEVIDSRYRDFSFALPDVVADNASSALFSLGPVRVSPTDLDLALEAVSLSVDGHVTATATGAAVQGHPAEALALAANSLGKRGQKIPAGAIVLTGGLTDAVPVRAGSAITAQFTHLGSIHITGE